MKAVNKQKLCQDNWQPRHYNLHCGPPGWTWQGICYHLKAPNRKRNGSAFTRERKVKLWNFQDAADRVKSPQRFMQVTRDELAATKSEAVSKYQQRQLFISRGGFVEVKISFLHSPETLGLSEDEGLGLGPLLLNDMKRCWQNSSGSSLSRNVCMKTLKPSKSIS